jgi:hypothetical protein
MDMMSTTQRLLFLVASLIISLSIKAQNKVWERHVIDSSFSGADGVRLADVNRDGLLDIATGWEEGGFTKVYIHPGYTSVKQNWPSVIVGLTPSVEDAVFMDVDGNGALDVISSTEGKNKKIYFNWAPDHPDDYLDSSKWVTQVLPASDGLQQWMFALPAQIDGFYGVDLIAGSKNHNAKIGWFQAPEISRNLHAWEWHPISSATWVMSLFIRDMDADGDLDIITSDRKPGSTNGVRWMENPGDPIKQKQEWDIHDIGAQNSEVMFMDVADLDGDGLEDVVATESTNQHIVFIRKLDGSGLAWKSYPIDIPKVTGRAKAVKVGDMNGDGRPDLVHSTNTMFDDSKAGIFWLSYTNEPSDSVWVWHELSGPEGYKFDRIELLDLDGDGDLDVLTCEENYGHKSQGLGVIWYENPLQNKARNIDLR